MLSNDVDVAFVQSGTFDQVADDDVQHVIRGIAAIGLEPLWVFYRQRDPDAMISDVAQFRGLRVGIGPPESGTNVLSRQILRVNGITAENTTLVERPMIEAAAELQAVALDAAFFVSSYEGPIVHELLDSSDDELRLMGFRRYQAYVQIFPFLDSVQLCEGVLDLEENLPSRPSALLAPSILLACRHETHPRVVEQLITSARMFHKSGSLLNRPGRFPTVDGIELPLHETADTYVRTGESLMSRLVPYWAMHWVVRVQFLLLPLLTLWIPFFKILPLLYRYRIGTLLKKHYAALRDVESAIENADSDFELNRVIQGLESLRNDMERLSRKIPAFYQQEVYHWRSHVAMVQEEARLRLDRQTPDPADES